MDDALWLVYLKLTIVNLLATHFGKIFSIKRTRDHFMVSLSLNVHTLDQVTERVIKHKVYHIPPTHRIFYAQDNVRTGLLAKTPVRHVAVVSMPL